MSPVRAGTPAEHDTVLAVWREAEAARSATLEAPGHADSIRERLGLADTWLLVAAADDVGEVRGFAAAMSARDRDGAGDPVPGLCHVFAVFVRPSSWGKGLGGQLVDGVITEARVRGYLRIQLWTHEDNHLAQRLYSSRGFRRTGDTKQGRSGELIGLWSRHL